MTTGRRNFIFGALAGVSAAGAATVASRVASSQSEAPPEPVPQTPEQMFGKPSFAQQGEDLALESVFGFLRVAKPSYIDIGAGHPIIGNNTYKFYRQGGRGVLVEPNPKLAELLRQVRPNDTVIEAGIG